jgi:hypothetical protein
MSTIDNYKQRLEERKIIKQETKTAIIICLCVLGLNIILGVAAFFIKVEPTMKQKTLEKIYWYVYLGTIMLLIAIMAVRKIIYYSPKLIRPDFSIPQVLAKWKRVDLWLLLISEIIPICALVMTFLGLTFDWNYPFFIGSCILILLLTPFGIKVRSRLSILRTHFPDI